MWLQWLSWRQCSRSGRTMRSAQTPKPGGTLTFAVSAEPPNYDCHAQTSFAFLHPVRPHYSTLLKFDTANYPKVVGDLAESWTVSPDGLTYTFKLRRNVKFHDGSALTSEDIKATYDRLQEAAAGRAVAARGDLQGHRHDRYARRRIRSCSSCRRPTRRCCRTSLRPGTASTAPPSSRPIPSSPSATSSAPARSRSSSTRRARTGSARSSTATSSRASPTSTAIGRCSSAARRWSTRSPAGQVLAEFRGHSPADRDRLVQALGDRAVVVESPWVCSLVVSFNDEEEAVRRSARAPGAVAGDRSLGGRAGAAEDRAGAPRRRVAAPGLRIRDQRAGSRQAAGIFARHQCVPRRGAPAAQGGRASRT